jgi:hypothetical protein
MIPFKNATQIKKGQTSEDIENAIKFLRSVAQSERIKEMKTLYQYKANFKNSPLLQNKDVDEIFQDMEQYLTNPGEKNPKTFYIQLTTLLNAARQAAESYRMRLAQLTDKNRKTTQQIRADFTPARMTSDLDTLLKTAMGTVRRKDEESMSSKVVDRVIDFATTELRDNPAFLEHPYEVLAGLLMDFEVFLQEVYNKENNRNKNIEDLDINAIFNEYKITITYFRQLLQNNNAELNDLLADIKSTLGIKRLTVRDNQYSDYQERLEKNYASKSGEKRLRGMKKIKDIFEQMDRKAPKIRWELSAKSNKHGTIAEVLQSILYREARHIGQHSTAADVILVKLYQLKMNFPEDKRWLDEKERELLRLIKSIGTTERQDALHDLAENQKTINDDIKKIDKELEAFLNNHQIPEDIFIYHESLKFYLQAEQGIKKDFHGRELKIMNLLDTLYSANNVSDLQLIEPNIMYGIVTNLAEGAIGNSVEGNVEKYLSIFAGLLMFDDVKNIAEDVTKKAILQTNSNGGDVYHIHLYLINQIYIPGSILLSNLAFALNKGYEQMSFDDARIEITTGSMAKDIQYYVDNRTDKNGNTISKTMWGDYREKAANQTTARIYFLKSFLDFISDLQKYIN